MAMKSPAKPWELSRSQSTPITRAAVAPRVPPRTYGGGMSTAYAGGYGSGAYGSAGYGGGYGSSAYGSPYGRSSMYGRSSYGGYGRGMYGRMGGGMYGGGGGMYGGGMYGGAAGAVGPNGEPLAGPSGVLGTVQQTLHGFGQFSQLLDGSMYSMNESFMSLMEFMNVVGELRHHVAFIVKAVTALMLLQVTGKSIKEYFFGAAPADASADLASFESFSGKRLATRPVWPKVLLAAGLLFVFWPFLLRHVLRVLGIKSKQTVRIPQRRVVAVYDYRAESSEELNVRTGDLLVIEDDRSNADWWKGRDEQLKGNVGYFPANFVETLVEAEDDDAAAAEATDEEPMSVEQKAERKRRMDVVRERRRRDREMATASNGSSASLSRARGRPSSSQLIGPELADDEDERYAHRRLSYSGQQVNY